MHELTKQARTPLGADEPQGLAVTRSLVGLDWLRPQLKPRAQSLHKRLHPTPAYEQVLTVQGMGKSWAQMIPLETGAISRFPTVGPSAAYCRCVDSTQRSNGQRTGTGNVKNGHPYVAWASMEAAPGALRCHPAAQRFDHRPFAQSRNKTSLARQAVAHQLVRAGYDRMRDLVPCEETTAFG